MAVIGGITVRELRDLTEEIGEGGPRATKAWYVPNWSDRYTVANALLGLSGLSGGPTGAITLTRPMAYPESYNMWAQTVSIRGVGQIRQGAKQIAWDSAIVQTTYGVPRYQYDRANDPGGLNSFDPASPLVYATQKITRGTQFIELKPGTLTISGGSTKWAQPYARPVGVNTLNLTLHKLPYLPSAATRAKISSLNSVAVFGAAIKTLRLDDISTEGQNLSDGTYVQDVTYTMAERPEAAWDKVLHPDGASGWVTLKYGSSDLLPSFDFRLLIPAAYGGTG